MQKSLVLDALFPRTRQAILSAVLTHPERRWYLSELARYLDAKPSTLERELGSLTHAGVLLRSVDGNRVYFEPNRDFTLLSELTQIFGKTIGAAPQLTSALMPFSDQISIAFIFGSYARGEQTARSDVDLMLIGPISLTSISVPLRKVEETFSTEVNVTLYQADELKAKWRDGNHFLATVIEGKKIFLKGTEDELANALKQPAAASSLYKQDRVG